MSRFRAGAKEASVPMMVKPAFWRTLREARLSLAARACSGRMVTSLSRSSRASVAIPRPPGSTIDPVGDLGLVPGHEAGDAADELPVTGDGAVGNAGQASHPGHVSVERAPVIWVLGGKRGHPHRFGVAHLIEERVQVGVFDRP